MRNLAVGFVALVALLAGCSDDASGGGGGSAYGSGGASNGGGGAIVPSGNAATDLAAIAKGQCALFARCLPSFIEAQYGDLATCEQRLVLELEDPATFEGSTTTTADLIACVNALQGVDCSVLLTGGPRPAACEDKPGTLDDGKACAEDGQCKSTNCKTEGGACGVCVPRNAAGASCTSSDDCVEGLACVFSAEAGGPPGSTCKAKLSAGSACSSSNECADGLNCVGGTCGEQKAAKLGEACSNGLDGQACDGLAGQSCNPTTMVCTQVKFVGAGEPCGLVGQDLVSCKGGGECENGVCVAPAADGEACDITKGIGCLEPAKCQSNKCTLPTKTSCK